MSSRWDDLKWDLITLYGRHIIGIIYTLFASLKRIIEVFEITRHWLFQYIHYHLYQIR